MIRPLDFQVTNIRSLQIASTALATMMAYAQHGEADTEAGGILIGRLSADNERLVVDMATEPGPADKRSRCGFERLDPGHQADVRIAWDETDGDASAWGDWHTHAEPHPTPSALDLEQWRDTAAGDWYPGDVLFFVIVGTASVGVWEVTREGAVRRLEPIERKEAA